MSTITAAQLATKLGVTVATVRRWIRDAGIEPTTTVKETEGRGRPAFAYSLSAVRPLAKEVGVTL
jgi:predicted ArsR family transcriptional regulator